MVAALMLASMTVGRITARTGRYKIFPVIGSVLMLIGMAVLTRIGADTPLWQTDLYTALFGFGLGMNMQSLVLAMQNSVPAKDMGVASSSSSFFRSIGGTLGTSVFLSVLFSLAGTKISGAYAAAQHDPAFQAAARANPGQLASLQQHLSGGLNDTSFLGGLARAISHPFYAGFSSAGDVVFAVTAVLLVGAVVLSLFLKEVPLRLMSGNQARAQAEAVATPASAAVGQQPAGRGRSPRASRRRQPGPADE